MHKRLLYTAAMIILFVCSSLSAEPVVLKGPYAQNVTGTEATIMYQTSEEAEVTLNYGYTPAADLAKKVSIGTMHEVWLNFLQPGKKLYYRLEGVTAGTNAYAEGGVNSLAGSVQLPPFPRKYKFVVVGDTRSGHDVHSALSKLIDADGPLFVVNTGDLVSDGTVDADWQTFFDIEHDLMASTVLYPTLGNHDVNSGAADLYFKYFCTRKESSTTEAYYNLRFGNVLFLILDSEINFNFLGFSTSQGAWIRSALEAAKTDASIEHRFLAIHEGPYASNPERSGNATLRLLMGDLLTWKVGVIFSGHDHNYERGLSNNSITYVVTGGGGAGLYDVGGTGNILSPPHEVRFNKKDYNYTLVTIHGPWLKIEGKDRFGTVMDTWENGEEPVDECVEDQDCTGINKTHDPCAGDWECQGYVCNWTCAPADGGIPDSGIKDAGTKDSGLTIADAGPDATSNFDSGAPTDGAMIDGAADSDGASVPDGGATGGDDAPETSKGCSCSKISI